MQSIGQLISFSSLRNRKFNLMIGLIFFVKILLAACFSSGYFNQLFFPFVSEFNQYGGNPWQYFYLHHPEVAFPYPPLMLYILSPFVYLAQLMPIPSVFLINLLAKIPIYFADFFIFFILLKLKPNAKLTLLFTYLLSPIILFSSFMEGELDLIPVCFLLLSVFYLKKEQLLLASFALAVSLLCKTTGFVGLPFILIYIFRKYDYRVTSLFLLRVLGGYLLFSLPFIFSVGYVQTVFNNPQQSFIFNSGYAVGNLVFYPLVLSIFAIIFHFALYKKINSDLLLSYLSLAFGVFLIFAYPVPSWFVWVVPYLVLFLCNACKERTEFIGLYIVFSIAYLVFFLFFYHYPLNPTIPNLIFFHAPINFHWNDVLVMNSLFTLLGSILLFQIYLNYRFSIRSNALYSERAHTTLIGIAGDSGAGKSILLNDIINTLGENKVTYLEGDAEHRWERSNKNWEKFTHLDPKANLLHQQLDSLLRLKRGLAIFRRDYDHHTGLFTGARKIHANDYVLIAGLHVYYLPKARKLVDIRVYLDTDERLRRYWKIERDREKRGYTKEQVIQALEKRNPDREKHILPQKNFANLSFRYFVEDDFDFEFFQAALVKLQVTISANIDLENFYQALSSYPTLSFFYDYTEDLLNQKIIFSGTITATEIEQLAFSVIDNLEELISAKTVWQSDLQGIRQLMFLLVVSDHLKEGGL